MDIILIVLLTCGLPDTFIIKEPESNPVYYRSNSIGFKHLQKVLDSKPVTIIYKDNREICA